MNTRKDPHIYTHLFKQLKEQVNNALQMILYGEMAPLSVCLFVDFPSTFWLTSGLSWCHHKIDAYRIWFHVSGTPARHQWLQSIPAWSPLYTEGWPSFLSWESSVMSRRLTGFDMFPSTLLTIACSGSESPGYTDPLTG